MPFVGMMSVLRAEVFPLCPACTAGHLPGLPVPHVPATCPAQGISASCFPFGLPVFCFHTSFLDDHGQAEDQPDSNGPADKAQGYDEGVCVLRGWSRRGG